MIFFNAFQFIREAIESIFSQSYESWEVILVDDGSTDGSSETAREYAALHPTRVRYVEHPGHANLGMSASRNLGIRHSTGRLITFLDADDIWFTDTLQRMVSILQSQPEAGMAYATSQYWYSWSGLPYDQQRDFYDHIAERVVQPNRVFYPPNLAELFLRDGSALPCLCSLVVRREVAEHAGAFEEQFRGMYEDQVFLLKVCLDTPVYISSDCWSRYRQHPASITSIAKQSGELQATERFFLDWVESYLSGKGEQGQRVLGVLRQADPRDRIIQEQREWITQLEKGKTWLEEHWANWKHIAEERESIIQEQQNWIKQLEQAKTWLETQRDMGERLSKGRSAQIPEFLRRVSRWGKDFKQKYLGITPIIVPVEQKEGETLVKLPSLDTPHAQLDTADRTTLPIADATPLRDASSAETILPARRMTPISRAWGYDRGKPIDRYYIENFLALHSEDVHGRVLEIGDNAYTQRFGGKRVSRSDVLDVSKENPQATIVADLTQADHIPSATFDCIILTQTLHLIFDSPAAIKTLQRILTPGGVLLATFPGITRLSSTEWPGSWYWGFTSNSALRLFEGIFPPSDVTVTGYGNVWVAAAFLYGLATQELAQEELDYRDPEYDVLITVRALKGSNERTMASRMKRYERVERWSRRSPTHKGLILLYHHVGKLNPDPWLLRVSAENFNQHIQVLGEMARPMALKDLVQSSQEANLPHRSVAVTFDDGYADNLYTAGPLLKRHGLSATFFVTVGALGQEQEFWWDDLERIFLQPGSLPETLQLEIDGKPHSWQLNESASYTESEFNKHSRWLPWEAIFNSRQAIYRELWEILHPLPDESRIQLVDYLLAWAGLQKKARSTHRLLTQQELSTLAQQEGIEIGSHGLTHVSLATQSRQRQEDEIHGSKTLLEAIIDRPALSFAYPYGKRQDIANETVDLVRAASYRYACANLSGSLRNHTNQFLLPRFHVQDWDGDEFAKRLIKWLITQ